MSVIVPVIGPHVRDTDTVSRLMFAVTLALTPATLYGFYLFGWPAVNLFVITLATCLVGETVGLWLAGKSLKPSLLDGSALLTGWLLALSLPPWAPWWIGVIGGLFAIGVGKQVFGGIGQNLFNPAMIARVALLVSFPVQMTIWPEPYTWFAEQQPSFVQGLAITFTGQVDVDGTSGASLLGHVRTELDQGQPLSQILSGHYQPATAVLGNTPGSLGETSALLLLVGGVWLLWRGVITWPIPSSVLATVAVLASGFHLLAPERYPDAVFHLLSGSLILGAFFIATDPVTSPITRRGQVLFGIGCGALIYIIRTWGGYPEGVAFAVVLMNAATPAIDHYVRPRMYGRTRRGKPLIPSEYSRFSFVKSKDKR